jgi:hypothetical protein
LILNLEAFWSAPFFNLRRSQRPGNKPFSPTGKSLRGAVAALSRALHKNIPLVPSGKSILELAPSRSTEGRLAIVTDAVRDAVDAEGAADESA